MKYFLAILLILCVFACNKKISYSFPRSFYTECHELLDSLKSVHVDTILTYTINSGCVVPERTDEEFIFWRHQNISYLKKFDRYGSSKIMTLKEFLSDNLLYLVNMDFQDSIIPSNSYEVGCIIDNVEIMFPQINKNVSVIRVDQCKNLKKDQVTLINNIRSYLLGYSELIYLNYKLTKSGKIKPSELNYSN